MKANSELIRWLLDQVSQENITKYQISKITGVHQTTLTNLENGTSLIENLSFRAASSLTEYAEKIEEEKKMEKMYKEWRETLQELMDEGNPGSTDCGEVQVRKDFSDYAGLDHEITFEEMLELEENYKPENKMRTLEMNYDNNPASWWDIWNTKAKTLKEAWEEMDERPTELGTIRFEGENETMRVNNEEEEKGMQELWLKDYRGGYTLIYSIASDRSMSVDNILQFLGDETLDQMAEALGYDIRDLYENLTTEKPEYRAVDRETADLIILKGGDSISTRDWNGETWSDSNRQYAPVYEWTGTERNSTYLIGVVEV